MALQIDVISDVVCPWCFIGKRRLESALALYRAKNPDAPEPELIFHPFELNPGIAEEGVARKEYVARKFGEAEGRQVYERVAAIGREVGIPFAFDRIERQPNTRLAHMLIAMARLKGRQERVKEAFLSAYFIDGVDLSNRENVEAVAVGAGLDAEEVSMTLESPEALALVEVEEQEAQAIGVEGVPFFIFNRRVAVSGAHDPDILLQAMLQAEEEARA